MSVSVSNDDDDEDDPSVYRLGADDVRRGESLGPVDDWAALLVEKHFERFRGLRSLVLHQLEAFDYFVTTQQKDTLRAMGPVVVKLSDEPVFCPGSFARKMFRRELLVHFEDIKTEPPHFQETDGTRKLLFPAEARVRQMTYAARQSMSLRLEYLTRNADGTVASSCTQRFADLMFLTLPVMCRSGLCNTTLHPYMTNEAMGECSVDPGGYFVISGQEKTILQNQSQRVNMVLVSRASGPAQKYLFQATMKFVQECGPAAPKHMTVFIARKPNMYGHPILVSLPRLLDKQAVDLFVLFRALGATTDAEILSYIVDMSPGGDEVAREAVVRYLHASIAAQPRDVSTREQAVAHIKTFVKYEGRDYLRDDVVEKRKLHHTYMLLREDVFPQWGRQNPREKMAMLGHIVSRLLWTALGWAQPDSRDAYLNKRMNGVNVILNDLFRHHLLKTVKGFQNALGKYVRQERKRAEHAGLDPTDCGVGGSEGLTISKAVLERCFKSVGIQRALEKAMRNGDFSTSMYSKKVGYCQLLKRLSMVDSVAHLNRIMCCTDKNNEEIVENRKFDAQQIGHLCLLETPENAHVGQILQLAISVRTALPVSGELVLELLRAGAHFRPLAEYLPPVAAAGGGGGGAASPALHTETRLFVNGVYLGLLPDPLRTFRELKRLKRAGGALHAYTGVVMDYARNELRVSTESGRTLRPLLVVDEESGQVALTAAQLAALRAGQIGWDDLVRAGAIEYVDAEEQWHASIYIHCLEGARKRVPGSRVALYDYAEISHAFLSGLSPALIPFIGMNPSTRNTYMSNMGKQAVGHYVTNYASRMDRSAFVQMFPGLPLVRTLPVFDALKLQYVGGGKMVIVCLMCWDGTNQEDSHTMNAGSVDRGLFSGWLYHTVKDEDRGVDARPGGELLSQVHMVPRRDGAPGQVCPDTRETTDVKDANYGKINRFGVVDPNRRIDPGDVIIAKIVPITGPRASTEGEAVPEKRFNDQSRVHNRSMETAYVDRNFVGRSGDGSLLTKTTLRLYRVPSLGDKFTTRQAQKVTCGRKVPEHMMPFCAASGLRPDIIINTHCIPSRMTAALIQEIMMGNVCALMGTRGNGAHLEQDCTLADMQAQLAALGHDANGQDVMVDPRTGEEITMRIFNGPAFFSNLKHQTIDKDHFRNVGPVVKLTRQPTEGRKADGGMRMGEMERDVLVAQGVSELQRDRFLTCSDRYAMYVCSKCGLPMVGNNGREYHEQSLRGHASAKLMLHRQFLCRACGRRDAVSVLELPYAYKLHVQEMMAINVCVRFQMDTAATPVPLLAPSAGGFTGLGAASSSSSSSSSLKKRRKRGGGEKGGKSRLLIGTAAAAAASRSKRM